MHDVIVDEERLNDDYMALHAYAEDLESRYKTYLSVLRLARLIALKRGNTARAFSAFIDAAKALTGQFDNIATDFEELSASFIREVDNVDDIGSI